MAEEQQSKLPPPFWFSMRAGFGRAVEEFLQPQQARGISIWLVKDGREVLVCRTEGEGECARQTEPKIQINLWDFWQAEGDKGYRMFDGVLKAYAEQLEQRT